MQFRGRSEGRASLRRGVRLLLGAALAMALFPTVSAQAPSAQVTGSKSDEDLLRDILGVYQSGGEEGLHAWVEANRQRVPVGWISRWAARGARERNEALAGAALCLAEAHGDRRCLADCRLSMGDYYLFLADYDPARRQYEVALSLYLELGDLSGQGNVYRREGDIHLRTAENAKALSLYERALPLFKKAKDAGGEASVYLSEGNLLARKGENEEALAMFARAFPLFETVRDAAGMGEVYKGRGDVYRYTSDKVRALEMYQKALPLFQEVGDLQNQGSLYFRQGLIYFDTSDDPKALAMFEKALPLFEATRDPRGQASVYKNLGDIRFTAGEHAKALEMYEKALPLFERAREPLGQANIYRAEGDLYQTTGEYEKALAMYGKALKIYEKAQSPFRANVYLSEGDTFVKAGQKTKEALEAYEKALALYQEAQSPWGQASVYRGEGDLYFASGEDEKALAAYEKASSLFEQIQDSMDLATVFRGQGKVHARLGNWPRAVSCLDQALALDRVSGAKDNEAGTLAELMRVWRGESPDLAILYGKRSIILYQEIRANIRTFKKESQEAYRRLVSPTFRSLADLLIGQGRLPEAQQVLDLLKDEEFFEYLRRDKCAAGTSGTVALTPRERDAAQKMDQEGGELAALGREYGELKAKSDRSPQEEERLEELGGAMDQARREFASFQRQLAEEFAGQAKAKKEEKLKELQVAGTLQRVLKTMPDRCAAVYTVVLEERTWVVLATPEVQTRALCPMTAEKLRSKVALFQALLRNPAADPRPQGKELYDLLVAPVQRDLERAGIQTLVWSLDDVLRYVPMAALWDGEHYLAERYRCVVATGAKELLAEPPSTSWRAAGMGASKGKVDEGFRALPAVLDELKAIVREGSPASAGILPGVVKLDEAFTQAALSRALRDGYPVVHIASHYRFQPGYVDDSFLLLGDGSHLSLHQIQSMDFADVDLVTLSACETAVGSPEANGLEVDGLGMSLQERGAKSVIATLWPVADESTALLMREFYRRREEQPDLGKAEALRQAQMALLHGSAKMPRPLQADRGRGDPHAAQALPPSAVRFRAKAKAPYAHPYFWAPFILIGNWR
jgi:CHAT domain-containing protein/predicted negative regulator of RcsB-dependent stress response